MQTFRALKGKQVWNILYDHKTCSFYPTWKLWDYRDTNRWEGQVKAEAVLERLVRKQHTHNDVSVMRDCMCSSAVVCDWLSAVIEEILSGHWICLQEVSAGRLIYRQWHEHYVWNMRHCIYASSNHLWLSFHAMNTKYALFWFFVSRL